MQRNIQCVIPCGGNSTRIGRDTNKCLLRASNKTVLEHVVSFWQARGITEFIFIVGGDSAAEVKEHIHKLCQLPIVINRGKTKNLIKAVVATKPYIKDRFILALGDCVNFGNFIGTYPPLGVGVCIASSYELRKSYLVHIDGQGVTKLVEKPLNPIGLCGMGTLFLSKKIFRYIDRLKLPEQATSVDFTGALQLAIGEGETVKPVFFKGDYINVTYPDDIITVERLARIYNNQELTGKALCC